MFVLDAEMYRFELPTDQIVSFFERMEADDYGPVMNRFLKRAAAHFQAAYPKTCNLVMVSTGMLLSLSVFDGEDEETAGTHRVLVQNTFQTILDRLRRLAEQNGGQS